MKLYEFVDNVDQRKDRLTRGVTVKISRLFAFTAITKTIRAAAVTILTIKKLQLIQLITSKTSLLVTRLYTTLIYHNS